MQLSLARPTNIKNQLQTTNYPIERDKLEIKEVIRRLRFVCLVECNFPETRFSGSACMTHGQDFPSIRLVWAKLSRADRKVFIVLLTGLGS